MKELDVWQAAGLVPSGAWYQTFAQGDQGNTATLRFAERLQAYTLIDRATLLAVRAQGLNLQVLLEGDPLLTNLFSLIPVAPACSGRGRLAEAEAFVSWVTGAEGRALIAEFGRERFGEPLFYLVGLLRRGGGEERLGCWCSAMNQNKGGRQHDDGGGP